MKQFFIGLKKAWMTLPVKAKKVYKLSAVVIGISGFYLYGLLTGESELGLSSSVSISKNPAAVAAKNGESQIDYQQAQLLAEKEAALAENTKEAGDSYLPDFKVLENASSEKIDFSIPKKEPEKPEQKPKAEPEFEERRFPARQSQVNQNTEDAKIRAEERKKAIEARISAYAGIVSVVQSPKAAGTLVQHYKPVTTNATEVASAGGQVSSNQAGTAGTGSVVLNKLTTGDVLSAKVDNYINTDNSSKFVRLTLLEGELEGAIVMGEFERVEGVIVITTKTISKNGITTPFQGVVVTPDGRMETGLTTDTDYHTLYRWSALVFSGALKGAGEMYLTLTDEVITEYGTVTKVNEKDPMDIVMGVAKGVGDATADIAAEEFTIPPTVILDPMAMPVVGIMLTSDAEAPWFSSKIRDNVH
ncbi:hypothetical protein GCM10011607_28440 [Shewanella inventionis]|uniref:TrbI/VirB10 family protein n=1 Tax=Shewanella inventionis TaxID=1738770 RepID=A0ABQ1JGZ4_9GAMM|nr:DotG/IcmE/VirB10 family protein [Shewanella inventionis]GGB66052.1 hypothetical protein GCM10011607_28440 [Shewanella inventionis]